MVDLDRDVAVRPDGTVEIQDEDEVDVHQVRYQYTPEMIRRATEETHRIARALEQGQEPFFAGAARWLRRVTT
jgi:predicted RNA-binding protein associated with RNAse of E/G family